MRSTINCTPGQRREWIGHGDDRGAYADEGDQHCHDAQSYDADRVHTQDRHEGEHNEASDDGKG